LFHKSISNGKIEPLSWLTPYIPRKNNERKILKKEEENQEEI
jgi:hypothetical protein